MIEWEHTYEGELPYIFVSYAHADREVVSCLTRGLDRQGFRVWLDAGIQHGAPWQEHIAQRIAGCSCMLVFLSPAAAASRNCCSEISYAFSLDKPMLVVYLEDTILSPGLQMQLGTIQAMRRSQYSNDSQLLAALCAESMLQSCVDTDAAAMEKEMEALDPWITALGSLLGSLEGSPAVIDPQRMAEFREAYHILQSIAEENGALLTYQLHEPLKSMGSITLQGADLTFEKPALLAQALVLADSVEVYPLTDGNVRAELTFHRLARY